MCRSSRVFIDDRYPQVSGAGSDGVGEERERARGRGRADLLGLLSEARCLLVRGGGVGWGRKGVRMCRSSGTSISLRIPAGELKVAANNVTAPTLHLDPPPHGSACMQGRRWPWWDARTPVVLPPHLLPSASSLTALQAIKTMALVGSSGSGKSTVVCLLEHSVFPPSITAAPHCMQARRWP